MSGDLPPWIVRDPTSWVFPENTTAMLCPGYEMIDGGRVTLSPSYYGYKGCRCSENYFGRDGHCTFCSDIAGCSCREGIISGCFPTPDPGLLLQCSQIEQGN